MLPPLPPRLQERTRWLATEGLDQSRQREFVLYWMHNAVRGHENPALDVAISLARELDRPLLVYHAVAERYPFAADRHHAFLVQGAVDVSAELADRGVAYAFHLERRGHRGQHLRDLTRRAAVLVTEEHPVEPIVGWVERLQSRCQTPIAMVDASNLAPVTQIAQLHTTAASFRAAARPWHRGRAGEPYRELSETAVPFAGTLGFEPLRLPVASLSDLLGQCEIDHSIAPVGDMPGGSRAAGRRWEAYCRSGLKNYRQTRNDPLHPDGASVISAAINYGMLSPFRVARDAAAAGATKFLDEFLVWRELAFHYCFARRGEVDTLDAIPSWARSSLAQHAGDAREAVYDWETLATGRTNEPLWNATQRDLLKHGHLHNNLRMTWGKALLEMTTCPETALRAITCLNHRYAIDGRAPASYGGILWCLGLFDRAFEPPKDVFGVVRPRSIRSHARRLDVAEYAARVDRPIAANPPRVAIIGAGISGLAAAQTLSNHDVEVVVFEKSRGVGGRLATRRADVDGTAVQFDHGAQYFTVRDDRLARAVCGWTHRGVVAPWNGRIVELAAGGRVVQEKDSQPRYVGVPNNNAIAKVMAEHLEVITDTPVESLHRRGDRWQLRGVNQGLLGTFDIVITACPAPQAAALLPPDCSITPTVAAVSMVPCWSVMLRAGGLNELPFDGAFINNGPLSWIARDDAKPGRPVPDSANASRSNWVLHASVGWSREHLEESPVAVTHQLLQSFAQITGQTIGSVDHAVAHRWRYANVTDPIEDRYLMDHALNLGACGDWCGGPRVEGAFLSGQAVAGAVLRKMVLRD